MKYGYARISSESQSFDEQINALLEIGVEIQNIFKDISSGVKAERKEQDNLISTLKEGDYLYVFKIDRIARNTTHLSTLIKSFEDNEINFISIQEPFFDTTTSNSIYLYSFFKLIRKLEKEIMKERAMKGIESERRRCVVGGRKRGLSLKALNKAKVAETLYKESKFSIEHICELLEIGSRRTLYKYLRSRNVKIGSYKKRKEK
ncbi:MAG: hypothetical protein A3K10_16605 [Bacteroidetes bacterium RIFCSPLOWO2_12_FULL_31_6]|nr:MAG: hypothetical protein A3K10_16605 [Bacteroidetes bacterium RIFCSPLOWO2_12_FULL_31_6]